jgi:hypothetical protein
MYIPAYGRAIGAIVILAFDGHMPAKNFQRLADAAADITSTDWKDAGRERVDLFPNR